MIGWRYALGICLFLIGGDIRWRLSLEGAGWYALSAVLLSIGLYYLLTEDVVVKRVNRERAEDGTADRRRGKR